MALDQKRVAYAKSYQIVSYKPGYNLSQWKGGLRALPEWPQERRRRTAQWEGFEQANHMATNHRSRSYGPSIESLSRMNAGK